MILQPGQRGSNGSHGKREPYLRKNIVKRNYALSLTSRSESNAAGCDLTKPQYIKRAICSGRSFGELVVLDRALASSPAARRWWSVICLCGNIDVIRADQLIREAR